MLLDAEQQDELGLALVRGPFDTLEEARGAVDEALAEPAPTSDLAARAAVIAKARANASVAERVPRRRAIPERPSLPPPIEIRQFRGGDGAKLRALWEACGMSSVGDDDETLATMARRNPGTVLIALQAGEIVASALGGWDGRRGWIYHLAVAEGHRRAGLGRELVGRIEAKLRELGALKVNAMVVNGNGDGAAFWEAMGYVVHDARQFGKVLE